MNTLTPIELQERRRSGERFQMIDVRSPGEYAAGHVPCAINLPMDQMESRLDDVHHRDPVVLICQSGRRAALSCELLQPFVNDLIILEGGTSAWARAGLPLVRGTVTRWSLERQVRLAAGLLTATGAALALVAHPLWAFVPLATGGGLVFAGATNICGMASLLARMPWNGRPRSACAPQDANSQSCCR